MQTMWMLLLISVPAAAVWRFLELSEIVLFFLAAFAILPLAKYIGEATEELAAHTGTAMGALLNATFGNATEFIISIFALRAGLVEVVKASITGSIIGNLLLILGMAMLAGGWRNKKQQFNSTVARAGSSTLLLAVIALVMPAIFMNTASVPPRTMEHLSIFVAVLMLIVYAAGLWFLLVTHKHLYKEEIGKIAHAGWSKKKSMGVLCASTLAVSWMSEILVGSIEPVVARFGWTELFIGVIFIAIVGNAAEHASAIVIAAKNRMDLALQIATGSATQIAMFVAPALVLISLFFPVHMSLVFGTFELVAIISSVLIANVIINDGESNWLEGFQLLIAYAILAIAFFFHP